MVLQLVLIPVITVSGCGAATRRNGRTGPARWQHAPFGRGDKLKLVARIHKARYVVVGFAIAKVGSEFLARGRVGVRHRTPSVGHRLGQVEVVIRNTRCYALAGVGQQIAVGS